MAKGNIILKDIEIQGKRVNYHFRTSKFLSGFFNFETLKIEYNQDLSDVPVSILTIPFVSVMLPIMWVTDSVLWVKEVDYTFYEASFKIRRAYQELYPAHKLKGRFTPAKLVRNSIGKSDDAFALFSGGVDAHTSYIRNKNRISHLVNIQGFYKNLDELNKAADADYRDIKSFAEWQNKIFDYIKSNFAKLINDMAYQPYAKIIGDSLWHGFQHSMAFISIAIPLAYKYKCSNIIIASSFTIGDSRVCASYPTTDSEFSFAENGITIHDGFELNRQDKIRILVNYQRSLGKPYPIRVCSFNDHNCCECEKCFRTILGIVAECGDVKNFSFNIDKPLAHHWQEVIGRKAALMGFATEQISHWPHIKSRMKENYHLMNQEQKDFVDWFFTYDFAGEKKRAVRQYYRQNFFSIIRRKLNPKR